MTAAGIAPSPTPLAPVPTLFPVFKEAKPMSNAIIYTAQDATTLIKRLRLAGPLVHCLTNYVVQNFTANVLLAIGASPAMLPAIEEVEEFSHSADALLINVGTLEKHTAESMFLAAKNAHAVGLPWVLDPVAIGVAGFRTDLVRSIIPFQPAVIRANPSEILSLADKPALSQGPDSHDASHNALTAARELALKHETIIAVTGEVDYVTNGQKTYAIHGGHINLTRVTGTGCSLSAMVAAFVGSSPQKDYLEATAAACFMMKSAGEQAMGANGLGSFAVLLLDALSTLGDNLTD